MSLSGVNFELSLKKDRKGPLDSSKDSCVISTSLFPSCMGGGFLPGKSVSSLRVGSQASVPTLSWLFGLTNYKEYLTAGHHSSFSICDCVHWLLEPNCLDHTSLHSYYWPQLFLCDIVKHSQNHVEKNIKGKVSKVLKVGYRTVVKPNARSIDRVATPRHRY